MLLSLWITSKHDIRCRDKYRYGKSEFPRVSPTHYTTTVPYIVRSILSISCIKLPNMVQTWWLVLWRRQPVELISLKIRDKLSFHPYGLGLFKNCSYFRSLDSPVFSWPPKCIYARPSDSRDRPGRAWQSLAGEDDDSWCSDWWVFPENS